MARIILQLGNIFSNFLIALNLYPQNKQDKYYYSVKSNLIDSFEEFHHLKIIGRSHTVDKINGLPVFCNAVKSGRFVKSAEATLYAGTLNSSV